MAMINVNSTNIELSELLLRVKAGEKIIIARNGNPIAKLTKLDSDHVQRPGPGIDTGKIAIAPDFNITLPEFDL